jgi:hypothetical protein
MTAKELFELYGPLWPKVPETRPFHCDDSCNLRLCFWDLSDHEPGWCGWWWFDPKSMAPPFPNPKVPYPERTGHRDWTMLVSPTEAAALCRVAAEEYILKESGFFHIGLLHTQTYEVRAEPDSGPSHCGFGNTIHHALVSAAIAVAGGAE